MVSVDGLVEAARDARVETGGSLLIHASAEALEQLPDGASTLIEGLRIAVGDEGTIVCSNFDYTRLRPRSMGDVQPVSPEIVSDAPYQRLTPTPEIADALKMQSAAVEVVHPAYSFVATGPEASFITSIAPMSYPLGSSIALDRLHQLNGRLLLIGCDHDENSLFHLAEIWEDAPYARRGVEIEVEPDKWAEMAGAPGCTNGFKRLGPVLRQARIEKSVEVGGIVIRSMPIRQVVSMAIATLQGSMESLLCVHPDCKWCQHARAFTRDAASLGNWDERVSF